MRLDKIEINNFRGIKEISIRTEGNVTVLCGINGAGKTTILDAIANHLSWYILKMRRTSHGGSGDQIVPSEIKIGATSSKIHSVFSVDNQSYAVTLVKTKPGHMGIEKSDMTAFTTLANHYKTELTETQEKCSIPLLVYYQVERTVDYKFKRIKTKHTFDLLSTYENALDARANFRLFFEWFRTLEDEENERFRNMALENNVSVEQARDPKLQFVRTVIEEFTGFSQVSIKRSPLRMQLKKDGTVLNVDQLSEGERDLFALVGDLARRIVTANPTLENPSEGKGIVLIDEIELHLHPTWQKKIIEQLTRTFPNLQFIVTTHSPQVLSEVKGDSVILLSHIDGEINQLPVLQSKGLTSNEILQEILATNPINQEVQEKLDEIFSLIDDNDFVVAKERIEEFKDLYGSIPEIIRGEALMSFYQAEL